MYSRTEVNAFSVGLYLDSVVSTSSYVPLGLTNCSIVVQIIVVYTVLKLYYSISIHAN